MRWFARILGGALTLAGIVTATPEELFLVYLHRDPLGFLGEFRRHFWQIEVLGFVLIVVGLGMAWPAWRQRIRRSRSLRD